MNDELLVFVLRDPSTGADVPVDVISKRTFLSFSPEMCMVAATRLDERGQKITYSFTFDPNINKHALEILTRWSGKP